MSQSDNRHLADKLAVLITRNPTTLEADVARILLEERPDDIIQLMNDLTRHGCQTGLIGPMVYYADTHAFFDRHYEARELLREETVRNLGQPMHIGGDLKNALAWFAFEETAFAIGCTHLGLDL